MSRSNGSRSRIVATIALACLTACSVPGVTFTGSDGGTGIDAPTDGVTVVALVVSTMAVTVGEADTATFTVSLSAPPASPILISVDSADDNRVGVTPSSIQLDATNWNLPRTVTLSGREDADTEDEAVAVAVSSSVGDASVNVTVTDNDMLAIVASPAVGLQVSEGGTASITVKLSAQPSGTVTVTVASSDLAVATVTPTTLSFGTGTWDLDQTVVISGQQDADVVDATAMVTLSATDLTSADVPVLVIDDDVLGIQPSTTNLGAVNEGGTASFTVRLTQQPGGTVTVAVGSSDGLLLTAGPTPLTFTTVTWMTPQTVTVNLPHDVDTADESANVTLMATGLTTRTVAAVINDDDVQSVTATASPLPILEGATATLNVRLAYQPSADLVLSVTSLNTGVATVSTGSLTFTAANYATTQPVVVTAPEDADAAAGMTTIRLESLPDALSRDVPVAVTDNDQLLIETSVAAVTLGEAGSAMFGVRLTAMPGATVTVSPSSGDPTSASIGPASLMFTTADYGTFKMFTVTGVADVDLVNESFLITLTASGLPSKTIDAVVTDDDLQRVVLSVPSISVNEAGSGTVGVSLAFMPAADTVVTLMSVDATAATVTPTTRTFTPATYATPQNVTIAGVGDADAIDDTTTINATAPGATAASLMVTVNDDDALGIETSVTTTSVGEAGTQTFGVRLTAQPAATTTVTVMSSDPMAATALPATRVFSTTDWNTYQDVTLTGVADADGINDSISVNLTSAPLTMRTVTVTVVDDDVQDILLSAATVTLGEAGTATFGVRLATMPAGDVTVNVNSANGLEATAAPTPLTFTTADYASNKTVTVTGVADLDLTNDTVLINMSSAGLTTRSVTATVNDDDTQVVETSAAASITITEGAAATPVGFRLRYIPTANVTVTVTAGAGVAPATTPLTFMPGTYGTYQNVNITGVQDADAADVTTTVTASAPSSTSAVVNVTVDDDDVLGLETDIPSLTITEGSTGIIKVRLTAQPLTTTTVMITSSDDTAASVTVPSTGMVTFDSGDWNVYKNASIFGVQDVDVAADGATITFASTGLTSKNVGVTVTDDDILAITTDMSSLSINEGGAGMFYAQLSHQPSGPVTVNLSSSDVAVMSISNGPPTLNFTISDWNLPHMVGVNGLQDADAIDSTANVVLASASTATKLVPVTVIDDDIVLTDLTEQMGPFQGGTAVSFLGGGFAAGTTGSVAGFGLVNPNLVSTTRLDGTTPNPGILGSRFAEAKVTRGPSSSTIPRAFYFGAWEPATTGISGGSVNVVVAPGSSRAYAGTEEGVYASADSGTTWTRASSGLPDGPIRGLSADPGNQDRVFAATSAGIYVTVNGGTNWARSGTLADATTCVTLSPQGSNQLFACTADGAVFRSIDSGVNWTASLIVANPRHIAAASNGVAYLSAPSGVYRTDNSGVSWQLTSNGLPFGGDNNATTIHPFDTSTVFAASPGGIYRTFDSGASWQQVSSLGGNYAVAIAIDPTAGTMYAASSNGVYSSDVDDATNWTPASIGMHPASLSTRTIAMQQFGSRIFVGSQHYGVQRSTDGASSWNKSDSGIIAYSTMAIAPHPTIDGTAFAAPQGMGIWRTIDRGMTWTESNQGITGNNYSVVTIAYAPSNPNIMYAGFNGGGVWKSLDGGNSWSQTGFGSGSAYALAIDPTNVNIAYAAGYCCGNSGVWKTTDGGQTWLLESTGISGTSVQAIAFAGGVLLASEVNNGIYRSTDGAQSWTLSNTGITNNGVNYLLVDPAGSIYAQGTNQTYRSSNGGLNWSTVATATRHFAFDPSRSATAYVLGGLGFPLRRTLTSFGTLVDFTTGLPDASQGFMAVDRSGGTIYVGRDNRGLHRVSE